MKDNWIALVENKSGRNVDQVFRQEIRMRKQNGASSREK